MAASTKHELLKQNVQQKFGEIRAALYMREKLLLRQIEVITTSQNQYVGHDSVERSSIDGTVASLPDGMRANPNAAAITDRKVKFLTEREEELLAAIRSFGRFHLDNMNPALHDLYLKNEDYIAPSNDHEIMYKYLQRCAATADTHDKACEEQPETIIVDFTKNKSLIEHNAKHMNESIINITLQEAKELIRKAKAKRDIPIPPLNLEELDDELESSIAEAVSSLGHESPANTKSSQTFAESKSKPKMGRFKPKITINNCNGTINLRNISSLTINCAAEELVSADIPVQSQQQHNKPTASDSMAEGTKSAHKTKAPSVTVESSSTGTVTPTGSSSSSYLNNATSRSHSKKQKNAKKSHGHAVVSSMASIATTTTASTASTVTSTSRDGTSNTQASAYAQTAYPYEFGDNDDHEVIYSDADENETAEPNSATCDFYNRLLNEIKNSLKEKANRTFRDNTHCRSASAVRDNARPTVVDGNSNVSSSVATSFVAGADSTLSQSHSQTSQPSKRLVLKNFENLKIILESSGGEEDTFHPVQIEQWLAEIISETDLEPMQNTDILEHSKIHNETSG